MNIFVTLVLFVVIVAGTVFSRGKNVDTENVAGVNTDNITEEETSTPNPTQTPTPAPQPVVVSDKNETPQDFGILEYRYPSSMVVSSDSKSLVLESLDDSDRITDWYKDKIAQKSLSVRTSVKTKTNGKVLNELVGSNGQKQVSIKISGQSSDSQMRIAIVLDI